MTKYYVGDIGYVASPSEWESYCYQVPIRQELLRQSNEGDIIKEHYFDGDGSKVFYAFSTAAGDGTYIDNAGRRYSVDSGGIGCIDVRYLSDKDKLESVINKGLAHIVEMEELFPDRVNWQAGTIIFADTIIDTGDL
jgi:hypothetical protein